MKIAMLDDDEKALSKLRSCIVSYGEQFHLGVDIAAFSSPLVFLSGFKPIYDMVFLDIEMPHKNGIEVARAIRRSDEKALLIFTTLFSQFAIKAYEVNAFDYLLKPIEYDSFAPKMKRAVDAMSRAERPYVTVSIPYGFVRIAVAEIYYVDVYGHRLSFHTNAGVIETRGKIADYEQSLKGYGFLRCNRSCLLNAAHIKKVEGYAVDMGIAKLSFSRNYYRDGYKALEKAIRLERH